MGALDELQRATTTFALLQEAEEVGLLAALADSLAAADVTALAERLGVRPARVDAVLQVLAAHGIAERRGEQWGLTAGWDDLVSGNSPIGLTGTLGLGRVWSEQFRSVLHGGHDYWELDPADRRAVATGISPDPRSPTSVQMVRSLVESLPGVPEALESGGRIIELGCGLASRLCGLLQAYPKAHAVGIELDPDLVDAARERAAELGVLDRLQLVVGDAADYDGGGAFDLANWSQFFFPESTRRGALAAAFQALRPGGWVSMPVVWDGTPHPAQSADDRELAEMRLVLDLWNVPMRTVSEVIAEVEAAGFGDVHAQPAPGFHVVRGRRP